MTKTILGAATVIAFASITSAQGTQVTPAQTAAPPAQTQVTPAQTAVQPASPQPNSNSNLNNNTTGRAFGSSGAGAPGLANSIQTSNSTMDRQAVTRVQDQLRTLQPSPSQSVSVSTMNGQIILSGTASSEAEKAKIYDTARAQAGSMPVKDEITVRRE